MSLWHLLAVVGILGASFWVAQYYSDNCRANGTRLRWHGALEGNTTFFSLQFIFIGAVSNHPDGWFAGALGIGLALIVLRRFVKNWRRPTDRTGD